nr:MAG TPA: hypothetical protein [Caudoviricetes sp.]
MIHSPQSANKRPLRRPFSRVDFVESTVHTICADGLNNR